MWHLWASCHPLDDPAATDRMTTEYATSNDGLRWTWHGTALAGRAGSWDERGVRIASVEERHGRRWALYDGRRTADENWEEQTGIARSDGSGYGRFTAIGHEPSARSPHAGGALRYVTVVDIAGRLRAYYEMSREDGAHELRTCLLPDPLTW